jgi:eukaryotic-like serine/threonine-protein kinase
LWLAGIPRWLHTANGAATAGVPATQYDQFLKAQDQLQHYYNQANLGAAISGFQEVLKADPNFALAQAGLGQAYFLQYRDSRDANLLNMAKQATAKALQLNANLAPPYITMARMEAMQGHTQLAMQQVQKAIALDPHSAEAYGALAEVYETDGRTGDALTAVQRAIDLAPDDWRWPVRLGIYYFAAGRLNEAALQLQKGVQLAPQNSIAYYDLGLARMQLGQLDEARSDLEKALSLEQDPDTYRALGSVLVLQGKYKEAIDMDKKSIDLRPGDYHTWGNLGGAYLWAGGREQSINAYRKAIELAEGQRLKTPDDPSLLVELADDYASAGQIDRSEVLLRKALALSPDDPNVNYRAGETYEIMGQRAAAIPLIVKALAVGYHATEFQRSPELAALRSDPAFQSALNKAKSENAVDSAKKLN